MIHAAQSDSRTPSAPPGQPPRHSASEIAFADAFIATLASSPNTVTSYRYGLGRLAEFISHTKYIDPPSPYQVRHFKDDLLLKFHEWMARRGYSAQTRTNYLAVTKRFLIWLDANDRLPAGFQVGKAVNRLKAARGARRSAKAGREPDPGIPRIVTFYDSIPLPFSDSPRDRLERLKLLRARAIVHTLYASAGRVSEVASLTREAVLDGRLSEVRITGKGGKDRVLLLTKDAQQAIAAYCRERHDDFPGLFISHGRGAGRPLGRGTLWSVVKHAAKALGLYKGTSPHAFRHYRAQQLLHEGMDLDVLQAYLGHADISTTRRIYAPYTALEKVRDQLETFGRSAKEAADEETA
ncbi:MAG TPA: tyrosine-type recombinase/integrase [Anaerolineae bacterium]|nr:tyrosine-type recombinase/integrase [Anaerolineae bacterium]